MPSANPMELEELVGFLGSPNPQIRELALENCVGYSKGRKSTVFTPSGLQPIKHLKALTNENHKQGENALNILINLSEEDAVVSALVDDDVFMKQLLLKITDLKYPNADQVAMLLANISRNDKIVKILTPENDIFDEASSKLAIDQLIDLFVSGAQPLNQDANFDYLSYVFANISRLEMGRKYFLEQQDYDNVVPISKLVVFTEHKSDVRRKGVASAIKNCCFDIKSHDKLLDKHHINVLPYLLLPITGSETYSDEDMDGMPEDLQLLPPDKKRDTDTSIITTHLETLLLLATTQTGRDILRSSKIYPIIRETHLAVEDELVEIACDRVVQVLMADELPQDGAIREEDETVLRVA